MGRINARRNVRHGGCCDHGGSHQPGGQTDYVSYKFTGNLVLQPGQKIQIQSRFNKSDWSNMSQGNDWSFAPYTTYTNAPQVTGYEGGALVWGEQPVSSAAALKVTSAVAFPNPSTGNGTTLSFTFSGTHGGASGSLLGDGDSLSQDANAKITLSIYSLASRLIWTETLDGGAYGTTGDHEIFWNEKDIKGAGLANGVLYPEGYRRVQRTNQFHHLQILILN